MYELGIILILVALFAVFMLLRKIQKVEKKMLYDSAWHAGKMAGRNEINDGYAKIKETEEKLKADGFLHIGSTIIMLSNEWQELSVGKIVSFDEKFNIPCIFDEVSESKIYGQIVLPYDKQMLTALLKLNPYERWNLIAYRNMYSADQYNWDKDKKTEFDPAVAVEILTKKGLI